MKLRTTLVVGIVGITSVLVTAGQASAGDNSGAVVIPCNGEAGPNGPVLVIFPKDPLPINLNCNTASPSGDGSLVFQCRDTFIGSVGSFVITPTGHVAFHCRFTATSGKANLRPTAITADIASPVVGQTVYFDSGIENTGDIDTGVFNIKWYVNGAEVGAYGSHLGVPAHSTVLDGNSQFLWAFDAPGTYTVTFDVDVDNFVPETNENDNARTFQITVNP